MKNREKLLGEIFELALQHDMNYFGQTQAVLAALQEKLNVGSQEVFKAGSALAGGNPTNHQELLIHLPLPSAEIFP